MLYALWFLIRTPHNYPLKTIRYKEQSARMMGHLISNAPRLIRPYTEPVLRVLVPKLKEPPEVSHPAVTLSVLEAIGELATVSGTEMVKWMKELLPIILDILSESSGEIECESVRLSV